jgi:hypothetical protein
MEKGCKMTIIHLSCVFKKLCAKIVNPTIMVELKNDVGVTLVLLEKEFPPFFDTMTHLLVYLVEELEICGPIHMCWMYHVECYMKILKECVRNKVRPKGSMVEGYTIEEALRFCTKYLQDFIATKRRVRDEKKTNVWLMRWLK